MAHRDSGAQLDHIAAAEESLAAGDHDAALKALDPVLAEPDHPGFGTAVRIAAAIHGHRGMLQRSAELFRHVPAKAIGGDAAAAAVAMLGVGDVEAAGPMLAASAHGAPTGRAAGMRSVARGLEQSLEGDGSSAVTTLVQAVASMAPVGGDSVLQDTPASLAAIVALHLGELGLAASVLNRAIESDLGGPLFRDRHATLLAWTAMMEGDLDAATEKIDTIGEGRSTDVRDLMFIHAIRVGVARRTSDITALASAWASARVVLPGHSVDLYSLLPLGELFVAAARLRDDRLVQPQVAAAVALLDGLGSPPLWSASFHWYGVQSAILTERPADLIPHADALVEAARTSRHAALLAAAGQTWLHILQDDVDAAAVRRSVQDLQGIGLSWDASRLAAQAAARTTDHQDMLDLLHAARSVQRPGSMPAPFPVGDGTEPAQRLTEREWEVGRLVVEGIGYREIGERLFISPKTVEHHVASIRRRLGAANRRDMLVTLRRLVETDPLRS